MIITSIEKRYSNLDVNGLRHIYENNSDKGKRLAAKRVLKRKLKHNSQSEKAVYSSVCTVEELLKIW